MPDQLIQSRQKSLYAELERLRLDALLVNPGPSLNYLTGLDFHLSERPVVAIFRTASMPVIVLPELEEAKVRELSFDARAFTYGEDPATWNRAFKNAAVEARLDFSRVGVEPRRLRVLELRLIEAAAPRAAYLNGEAAVAQLRMRKDHGEITLMRKAVKIAEAAVEETLKAVRVGVSEQDLAGELTVQMLRAGSSPSLPFSPIVAFGKATANPHAVPTHTTLKDGDLILFDWGANADGYFSDLTRMFGFGDVDERLRAITAIVEEANAAALRKAGPGVPCGDVDQAARMVIQDAGYGEQFIHRTGHGLGREGHEEPYIRAGNVEELQAGMVFTIEPGIYLPGEGGARIEDDVLITPDGAESMSTITRGLVELG